MSQHDYVISNAPGAAIRVDINAVLAAIVSLNSGAVAPATTFANMLWYDTANGILWKRTNANDAWEQILVGKASSGDGDTGTDDSKAATVARVLAMINKHKIRVGTGTIVSNELDIDAALLDVVDVSVDDDFTLNIPTNGQAGQRITIRLTQDGSGNHAITVHENFLIASELKEDGIVLSTAASAIDKIGLYCVDGTTWEVEAFSTDFAVVA